MAIGCRWTSRAPPSTSTTRSVRRWGLRPEAPGPAGAISHYCLKTDSGIRIVDVWETQEQFEAFAQTQIGPLTMEAGIPSAPQMQFFEVHNYFTPGS